MSIFIQKNFMNLQMVKVDITMVEILKVDITVEILEEDIMVAEILEVDFVVEGIAVAEVSEVEIVGVSGGKY